LAKYLVWLVDGLMGGVVGFTGQRVARSLLFPRLPAQKQTRAQGKNNARCSKPDEVARLLVHHRLGKVLEDGVEPRRDDDL
jgi:hypothetical protein